MNSTAELLRGRSDIWRAGSLPDSADTLLSSGFPALDRELQGGGWPAGVIELIATPRQDARMELLLPTLARASHDPARRILLVAPPLVPYGPGFAAQGVDPARLLWLQIQDPREILWALEVSAASDRCAVVLGWLARVTVADLRRLQLAARRGRCACFLMRPAASAQQASPAGLRLRVERDGSCYRLDLLKRRGGFGLHGLELPAPPLDC